MTPNLPCYDAINGMGYENWEMAIHIYKLRLPGNIIMDSDISFTMHSSPSFIHDLDPSRSVEIEGNILYYP